jgi:hypothetical protein
MNIADVDDHLQLAAYSYAYEILYRRPLNCEDNQSGQEQKAQNGGAGDHKMQIRPPEVLPPCQ